MSSGWVFVNRIIKSLFFYIKFGQFLDQLATSGFSKSIFPPLSYVALMELSIFFLKKKEHLYLIFCSASTVVSLRTF